MIEEHDKNVDLKNQRDADSDLRPKRAPAPRTKLNKALPTNRTTVIKQLDILRATSAASGQTHNPVSNNDVAKIAKVHFGTVSNCNPFFIECGLLIRVKLQNVPCDEVFAYADKYKWDTEKAAFKLAPVIRKTWFWTTLKKNLEFRSLTLEEAIELLSEQAGAGPDYKDQLEMLIEYLIVTGIVTNNAGIITAADEEVPTQLAPLNSPQSFNKSEINKIGTVGELFEGSVGLSLDPLLLALLKKIPASGQRWPVEKRLRWFKTFAMNVSQVYDEDDKPIELMITDSSSQGDGDLN